MRLVNILKYCCGPRWPVGAPLDICGFRYGTLLGDGGVQLAPGLSISRFHGDRHAATSFARPANTRTAPRISSARPAGLGERGWPLSLYAWLTKYSWYGWLIHSPMPADRIPKPTNIVGGNFTAMDATAIAAPAPASIFHQSSKSNFFRSISIDCSSADGCGGPSEDRAPAESQGSAGACPGNAQRGDA